VGKSIREIDAIVTTIADSLDWLDYLLFDTGDAGNQLNSRTRFESATQSPILIDDRVDAASLRIHYDDGSGVMTERFNRSLANFEIFADGIVLCDVLLNFAAHAFIDRSLASNRRLATLFGTAAR